MKKFVWAMVAAMAVGMMACGGKAAGGGDSDGSAEADGTAGALMAPVAAEVRGEPGGFRAAHSRLRQPCPVSALPRRDHAPLRR